MNLFWLSWTKDILIERSGWSSRSDIRRGGDGGACCSDPLPGRLLRSRSCRARRGSAGGRKKHARSWRCGTEWNKESQGRGRGREGGRLELELDSLAAARARLFRCLLFCYSGILFYRSLVSGGGALGCRGAVAAELAAPCSARPGFDFPPRIVCRAVAFKLISLVDAD
jgi:hypothetical protein